MKGQQRWTRCISKVILDLHWLARLSTLVSHGWSSPSGLPEEFSDGGLLVSTSDSLDFFSSLFSVETSSSFIFFQRDWSDSSAALSSLNTAVAWVVGAASALSATPRIPAKCWFSVEKFSGGFSLGGKPKKLPCAAPSHSAHFLSSAAIASAIGPFPTFAARSFNCARNDRTCASAS